MKGRTLQGSKAFSEVSVEIGAMTRGPRDVQGCKRRSAGRHGTCWTCCLWWLEFKVSSCITCRGRGASEGQEAPPSRAAPPPDLHPFFLGSQPPGRSLLLLLQVPLRYRFPVLLYPSEERGAAGAAEAANNPETRMEQTRGPGSLTSPVVSVRRPPVKSTRRRMMPEDRFKPGLVVFAGGRLL